LGQPWAPWTDLLRVDILNIIGFSMMLMGIVCRFAVSGSGVAEAGAAGGASRLRRRTVVAAVLGAAGVALLTPPLWTMWRPNWLPWFLESYVNGVHTFDKPQPWLFPMFPWSAFAFAGLAIGLLLLSDWARRHEAAAVSLAGLGGVAAFGLFTISGTPAQISFCAASASCW
jgi:hypothetical protein